MLEMQQLRESSPPLATPAWSVMGFECSEPDSGAHRLIGPLSGFEIE